MTNRPFSLADVLEIRRQTDAGTIDVRAWAAARSVSLETIRRIGRRDTYRDIGDRPPKEAPLARPADPPSGPSQGEIEASLEGLLPAPASPPSQTDALLDTLRKRGGG